MAQNNQLNSPEPFAITKGGTGVTSVTTAPAATSWAGWDANKNLSATGFIPGYTTTVTSGSPVVLTIASNQQQYFTGSTAQTLTMPVASTLAVGQYWNVVNNSSAVVTIQSSGANTILALPANSETVVTCVLASGTTAASWSTTPAVSGSGTVNSGTINQIAYYASTGTAVSGTFTIPTAVQANITQLGAQSQALNMNSHLINNVTDPVSAQDVATKNYVDNMALGGGQPVYAATTVALTVTQSGAGVGATLTNAGVQAIFVLDGTTPPLNSRILVKNQSSQSQNGVYTLTNVGSVITSWVLTRAIDYDTPTQINDTGIIPVNNGLINAQSGWYNTTTMVTVDTTIITFVELTNVSYPISLAHGGTNANLSASNGGIFYSTASAGAILNGTVTASKMLLSGSNAAPSWSTSTIPSSAGATANKLLLSDGTNYALSTPTFPNASATARKIIVSDGTNWVASTETYATPGTSGNVLTSDGTNWTSAAPAGAGAYTLIQSQNASSSATLDFSTGITSAYRVLKFFITDLVESTRTVNLIMQVSTNGGSTWLSTSIYNWVLQIFSNGSNPNPTGAIGSSIQLVTNSDAFLSGGTTSYELTFYKPAISNFLNYNGSGVAFITAGTMKIYSAGGQIAANSINAFRFLYSSGNILSGNIALYGIT